MGPMALLGKGPFKNIGPFGLLGTLLNRDKDKPGGISEMGGWDRTGRYGAGTSLLSKRAGAQDPLNRSNPLAI